MMSALEIGICALAIANLALLITVAVAKSCEIEWKQIALRRSNIIESNETEIRDLKRHIDRLRDLTEVLLKKDE
jgi:hypothetical protein